MLVAVEWRGGGGGLLADLVALPTRKSRRRPAGPSPTRCSSSAAWSSCATSRRGSCRSAGRAWSRWRGRWSTSPRCSCSTSPTSGIEESDTGVLGECMTRAARESGCAVVLVEHDVGFVMEHCDHILALNLGSVLAFGTPEEIRAEPRCTRRVFGLDNAGPRLWGEPNEALPEVDSRDRGGGAGRRDHRIERHWSDHDDQWQQQQCAELRPDHQRQRQGGEGCEGRRRSPARPAPA